MASSTTLSILSHEYKSETKFNLMKINIYKHSNYK